MKFKMPTKSEWEKSRKSTLRSIKWNDTHPDSRQVRRTKHRKMVLEALREAYPKRDRRELRKLVFNRSQKLRVEEA